MYIYCVIFKYIYINNETFKYKYILTIYIYYIPLYQFKFLNLEFHCAEKLGHLLYWFTFREAEHEGHLGAISCLDVP